MLWWTFYCKYLQPVSFIFGLDNLFQGAFGGISFTGLAEIAKKYDSSDELMKGLGISSALNR